VFGAGGLETYTTFESLREGDSYNVGLVEGSLLVLAQRYVRFLDIFLAYVIIRQFCKLVMVGVLSGSRVETKRRPLHGQERFFKVS